MTALASLTAYAEEERWNFDDRWINLFAFSVGHVARYARYLDLVLARYDEVSAQYAAQSRRTAEVFREDRFQDHDHERALDLQTRTHLEIETYYLFAKILLDRLAMHIEYCLGQARGQPLGSHHKLIDNFLAYAADRGLAPAPPTLLAHAMELRLRISDYRDDEITHMRDHRAWRASRIDADGRVAIAGGLLFPREQERLPTAQGMHDSLSPPELSALIDAYVDEMVDYLRRNLAHAKGYVGTRTHAAAPGTARVIPTGARTT